MIIKMELLIIMLFTEKNATNFFIYFLIVYLNVAKLNWLQPLTLNFFSKFNE